MLPRRTKRAKMGVKEPERRVFNTHRAFVRRHRCCVPDCDGNPIQFAHVRVGAHAGMAQKPPDWLAVSLCMGHHEEQHKLGERQFALKYRIDLGALAAEFSRRSPDKALREALREVR